MTGQQYDELKKNYYDLLDLHAEVVSKKNERIKELEMELIQCKDHLEELREKLWP